MRNEFSAQLMLEFQRDPFVFLTGDLGYSAFEEIQLRMGSYFINAGVAEQNMVSMAAGIVSEGISCWAYSIAPFIYARPFEQIRNDVSFHNLPVKLVGNGGGFAYGVMGDTHHAIEDYGVLLTLTGLKVFVPCFDSDLKTVIPLMARESGPTYLRLGYDEAPKSYRRPEYEPWRRVLEGEAGVIVVVGPIVGTLIETAQLLESKSRPEIWVVSELPLIGSEVPTAFWRALGPESSLVIVEEHVEQGSFSRMLTSEILKRAIRVKSFDSIHARHSFNGYSGSQRYYRSRNKLDVKSILDLSTQIQNSRNNSDSIGDMHE